ncbi:MAG: radical SAM protein [Chloroflexi bacterium]|nr:radical SAM protein [Chloroflexota bacterium]
MHQESATKTSSVTNPFYTYTILSKSERFKEWERLSGAPYAEYRRRWVENPTSQQAGDFPLTMNVEITTRCNLACTFCWHSDLSSKEQQDMPWELYQKLVDEAARYGIPAINLNGLGEPLMHRDLVRMIKYARDRGIIDIMFHTNGTIMTERTAADLIEAGLTQIIFSIDSPDKATYEGIRINANFDKSVANVHKFIETRDRLGSITPMVRVTMVLTRTTSQQVDQFQRMWQDTVDLATLQDMIYSVDWTRPGEPGEAWSSREPSSLEINPHAVLEESRQRREFFVCPYPYQSLKIHQDGTVGVCSLRQSRSLLKLGNAWETSIHELWTGQKQSELRRLHAQGKWQEVAGCRACDIAIIELHKKQLVSSSA